MDGEREDRRSEKEGGRAEGGRRNNKKKEGDETGVAKHYIYFDLIGWLLQT